MANKWRPKDWKNPHKTAVMALGQVKPQYIDNELTMAYEAGAEAMLEALKKMGIKLDIPEA